MSTPWLTRRTVMTLLAGTATAPQAFGQDAAETGLRTAIAGAHRFTHRYVKARG